MDYLQTAEDLGRKEAVAIVRQRLLMETLPFHDILKKHHSKTFAILYKISV